LDGIDNNSNDNGGLVLRTNVDAIQEFKIQTNSYSAEFGRSGGAVVNAITKSGSNNYHGGLFEFFRNSALDARDYFADYQRTVIRAPITWVSTVPTLAERSGDVSAPGEPTIYDPTTGLPFPGNKIPSGQIDSIAQAFMNLYPDPNQPGTGNNFIISPGQKDDADQGDGRLDYNWSQNDQVFLRYSMAGRRTLRPAPLPGLANGGDS